MTKIDFLPLAIMMLANALDAETAAQFCEAVMECLP